MSVYENNQCLVTINFYDIVYNNRQRRMIHYVIKF